MEGEDEARRLAAVCSHGTPDEDRTWARLEDQLNWYERKGLAAQQAYKGTKLLQLVLAAGVPLAVAVRAPGAVTASLGAVVVVLEGAQQLFQWQTNWVLHRSITEALKHEKYLYLAQAGPYSGPEQHRVLAERIEGLISQQHAK